MTGSPAAFIKTNPKGQINYKPCETRDKVLQAVHERFHVEPMEVISDFPRHIPYNSEKKSFQEKTGRDAFEVYQYTFRIPGEPWEKEAHVVMWDYTTGWVRITPFFKSLKHSKTMPAKVMTANPGLKDISHSITGGSISAQGYWIPYEAARAIAARFCWDIRHVLTPVFGTDFPDLCVRKDDPTFLKLSIDKETIFRCTEQAKRIREKPQQQPPSEYAQAALTIPPTKSVRPTPALRSDYESGYCTDTDRSMPDSPQSGCGTFKPINTPSLVKATDNPCLSTPQLQITATSIKDTYPGMTQGPGIKRMRELKADTPDNSQSLADIEATPEKRMKFATVGEEAEAAYTLTQLYLADAALVGKRRAL